MCLSDDIAIRPGNRRRSDPANRAQISGRKLIPEARINLDMPEIPDSLNNIAAPHALHISPQIDATSRSSTYTEDRRLLRCYVGRLMIVRRLLREASAPNCLHSRPCVRSFLSCITGQRRQKRNRSHLCLLSSGLPPTGSASKQPCTAGETELELEDPYHLVQVIPVNYVMQDMTRKCIDFLFVLC
jgi:hypothetical protein